MRLRSTACLCSRLIGTLIRSVIPPSVGIARDLDPGASSFNTLTAGIAFAAFEERLDADLVPDGHPTLIRRYLDDLDAQLVPEDAG